ncbi:MAG: hypothetical protein JWO92_1217 [Chitinophagaceae bacterium]|nr:hypothetical protein [Chitinophagaceae bacterium]
MTLKRFNELDEAEQFEALWNYSSYISDRLDGEHRIALYKFPTFYVELYYHIEHNALKKLEAITIEELSAAYAGLN